MYPGTFLALVIGALLLSDAYILLCVLRKRSLLTKILVLLPTLLYLAVFFGAFISRDASQTTVNRLLRLTLCIPFTTFLFTALSLTGRCLGRLQHRLPAVFNRIALAASALWLTAAVYGSTAGWKKITVREERIPFSSLPAAFDGYRIVQLSDLHLGTYASSPAAVREIVDRVNALHPDLIVFTGDLINHASEEVDPFAEELRRLEAADGVLSILGNHDYGFYRWEENTESAGQTLERLAAAEREAGWQLLRNEAHILVRGADSLAVIGVENAGSGAFLDRADLPGAMRDIAPETFSILLSHDPTHWRREVLPETGIALTLSGHTHAMQLRIGKFSPAKWVYPEWGGVYREGERTLVVSTGTGGNAAFRLGAWPQVLLLTLERDGIRESSARN